jgi:integrase
MSRITLTDRAVAAAKPPEKGKRRNIADAIVPGLMLRLTHTGRKSWVVLKRVGPKVIRLTLGNYPQISLEEARVLARDQLEAIGRAEGVPARLQASIAVKRAQDITVMEAIEEYQKLKLVNQARGHKVKAALDCELVGPFGDLPIREIRKRDLLSIVDKKTAEGAKVEPNRVVSRLKTFFKWAAEDRDLIKTSPAQTLKKPIDETARERVLSDTELVLIWAAANKRAYPFGPLIKLLILTGQRLTEVTDLPWTELDLEKDKIWRLPGTRTKNNRPNEIFLSDFAIQIIHELPKAGPYLFSTNSETPVRGHSNAKEAFDRAICKILNEKETNGLPHWTFHDLRRTFATGCARLSILPHVIEKMINHVTGEIKPLAAIYNRHTYESESKAGFLTWSAHIEKLVAERKMGNVA